MVSKKAIYLVDLLLEGDIKLRDGLIDPSKTWNSEHDKFYSLVQTLAGLLESNIFNLKVLKNELVGKCKHPKKMRDRLPGGQWYCMNCNLDL